MTLSESNKITCADGNKVIFEGKTGCISPKLAIFVRKEKNGKMQIIDITSKDKPTISPKISEALASHHNIHILEVPSSSVSAFSSMRIATALKKFPAEIIVTQNLKDATASVSAKKLTSPENAGFRIVLFIDNRTAMPMGLANEVLRNIDAWVFSDAGTLQKWTALRGADTSRFRLINTTTDLDVSHDPAGRVAHSPLRIDWTGPLSNTQRLEELLHLCASLPAESYTLHVYGSGKARYIMPVLDRAAEMENLNVKWHGDNYRLENIPTETDLHFPSEPFIADTDVWMMSYGIPLFTPESFKSALVDYPALSAETLKTYNENYSPCFHVEQIYNLFLALRP